MTRSTWMSATLALAFSATFGCQSGWLPAGKPAFSVAALPTALSEPQALDWSLQRYSSRELQAHRASYFQSRPAAARHVEAIGSATNWPVALTASNDPYLASDALPNGPAISYSSDTTIANCAFFLSKKGMFYKLNNGSGALTKLDLAAGAKTFSRTAVTLSPVCSHAYLYADDGTLYVVDTRTMAIITTITVDGNAGGVGVIPTIDPYASAKTDLQDVVYVPDNAGKITAYTLAFGSYGSLSPSVTTGAVQTVSASAIKAPALVLNGQVFVGDQAGNFYSFNYATGAKDTYALGSRIDTAPAIEIQDGSYTTVTDPTTGVVAPLNAPIFAFVNTGATCAWINLVGKSAAYSRNLYLDDNSATMRAGTLLNYPYNNTVVAHYYPSIDGGNVAMDGNALPPSTTQPWYNQQIEPADSNVTSTMSGGNQVPAGGPVRAFLRFHPQTPLSAGSVVQAAYLHMQASVPATYSNNGQYASYVTEIKSASALIGGSPWSSTALSSTNYPSFGASDQGIFKSGSGSGLFTWKNNTQYFWDVSKALGAPTSTDFALELDYDAQMPSNTLWQYGPIAPGVVPPGQQRKATQVYSVPFNNNVPGSGGYSTTEPANYTNGESRPMLELDVSPSTFSTPTIETAPVVDSQNATVYVFYTNCLFAIKYKDSTSALSQNAWSDTEWNPTTATGNKYTLFNAGYYGDMSLNSTTTAGATFNSKTQFVTNFTSPVLALNGTSVSVVSRYPTTPSSSAPTSWNYAFSRITLPLAAGASSYTGSNIDTTAGSQLYASLAGSLTAISGESTYAVIDGNVNTYQQGGNVFFGLAGAFQQVTQQ